MVFTTARSRLGRLGPLRRILCAGDKLRMENVASKAKMARALEQAPKKLIDFFDKSLLQHFDFERFLIVRTILFERKAL
jgi:hypothetical protein